MELELISLSDSVITQPVFAQIRPPPLQILCLNPCITQRGKTSVSSLNEIFFLTLNQLPCLIKYQHFPGSRGHYLTLQTPSLPPLTCSCFYQWPPSCSLGSWASLNFSHLLIVVLLLFWVGHSVMFFYFPSLSTLLLYFARELPKKDRWNAWVLACSKSTLTLN